MSQILEADLHGYQLETRDAVIQAIHEGTTRPMVVLPTGMGKTVVFSHTAKKFGAAKTLVIAHREELLTQAKEKMLRCWPGVDVGIVQGKLNEVHKPVIAASIQTLDRPNRRAQIKGIGLIIIDECHHSSARSYQSVLQHFGAFDDINPTPVLGVTATPNRSDGIGLSAVFQKVVKEIEILWGIQNGFLSDLVGVQCQIDLDLDKVRSMAGDFSEKELAKAMMEASAPEYVYQSYMKHASDRRAVVFTPTVEVARETAATFESHGIPATWISGDTPDRSELIERFQNGDFQIMCNCAVLTEGYDDPSLGCVIVARPTRSQGLYMQMVGRGTRRAPGKENCIIIDLMGNTKRHSLQSMASLYGVKDGEGVMAGQERQAKEAAAEKAAKPKIVISPEDIKMTSKIANLFESSNIIWNKVMRNDKEEWSVFMGADGKVTISEVMEDGEPVRYIIHHFNGLPEPVASFPLKVDLDHVRLKAEMYIRSLNRIAVKTVSKDGAWRDEPVSEGQKKMMRFLRIRMTEGMTKGQATDLINRKKAGG